MDSATPGAMSPSQPAPMVLVVEDEQSIRLALHFFLEDEDYQVAEASSVAEARDYLRAAASPYVVLLDFRMPGGNADVLLRAVEADARLRRHRYVLIPASQITLFSQDAQRLIHLFCAEVVYKPFDLLTLLAAVKRAEAQLSTSSPPP